MKRQNEEIDIEENVKALEKSLKDPAKDSLN